MGQGKAQTTHRDATSFSMTLAMTAVAVVCAFVVFYSFPGNFERTVERTDQLPAALNVAVAALVSVVFGLLFGLVDRWFGLAIAVSNLPGVVAVAAHRYVEPDPDWVGLMRGLSVALMLIVLFAGLVVFGRRHVELERLLFTEATSIAFFATLIAAGAYASLDVHVDLPRLTFGWVPVFGLIAWACAALLLTRRVR